MSFFPSAPIFVFDKKRRTRGDGCQTKCEYEGFHLEIFTCLIEHSSFGLSWYQDLTEVDWFSSIILEQNCEDHLGNDPILMRSWSKVAYEVKFDLCDRFLCPVQSVQRIKPMPYRFVDRFDSVSLATMLALLGLTWW